MARSIKDYNLMLYVISPSDQAKFIDSLKYGCNCREMLLQGLSGYFPYKLLDIFPTDQSDSHAWRELLTTFFNA